MAPELAANEAVTAQAIKVSRGDTSSLTAMHHFVTIQSARESVHAARWPVAR